MKNGEPITTQEKTPVIPFPGDLRDYFAGLAMAVMIPSLTKESHIDTISKGAYLMADAMLAARTQPKPAP